jgi:hypothetical protein
MYTGQMGGTWSLDFDYTIGETHGRVTGVVPQVDNYPTTGGTRRWLESGVYYGGKRHILTLAAPQSLTEGKQTVRAYINVVDDVLLPYLPLDSGSGFLIKATPFMRSMGHGSESVDAPLAWNDEEGLYTGTLDFSMEGDWRINLKVYDAAADTLIAGSDIDEQGDGSTAWWDVIIAPQSGSNVRNVADSKTRIYPTVSNGEFTVVTPTAATVSLTDVSGRTLVTARSNGAVPSVIRTDVPAGLYLVAIKSEATVSVHKILIRK